MPMCMRCSRKPVANTSVSVPTRIRRDVDGIRFFEERLNLTHRQPAAVERDDLVVEAREASLVFANQLRLERALTIPRHLDRHRPVSSVSTVFPLVPLR